METTEKITCYLGATIINPHVQKRVQRYSDHARARLGFDTVVLPPELHITILPPFITTYESASHLNLACACATTITNHPLVSSRLSIQKLATMKWDNETILHFPVNFFHGLHPEYVFADYVKALRLKIIDSGEFVWKEAIPETFHPHLTVLEVERTRYADRLEKLVQQSNKDLPLHFSVGYPTIYAKYKTGGWYPLSQDPNNDK